MNKILAFSMLLCLVGFLTLQSCSKKKGNTDANLTHIPSSAIQVSTLNLGSLYAKSNWSQAFQKLKTSNLLEELPAEAQNLLANPIETGIEVNGYLTYFTLPSKSMGETPFVAMLNISDIKKFEATLKDLSKAKKKQNYTLLDEDSDIFVAWNDELLVLYITPEEFTPEIDLRLAEIFKGPASNITTVANFKKYYDNSKEFAFYQCYDSLFANMFEDKSMAIQINMGLGMTGLTKEMFFDNVFTGTGVCENGRISGEFFAHYNPAVIEKFGPLFKNKLSRDYSEYLDERCVAVAAIALDLAEIDKLTKNTAQSAGMMKAYIEEGVIATPEYQSMIKGLNGDFLITYNVEDETNNGSFNVIAGVKDVAEAKKFLLSPTFNQQKVKQINANEYHITEYGQTSYILFSEEAIFGSNNLHVFENYKNAKKGTADSKLVAGIKEGTFSLTLSPKAFQSFAKSSYLGSRLQSTANLFTALEQFNLVMSGKKSTSEVTLVEKNKNSLEVLLDKFLDIVIEAKEKGYDGRGYEVESFEEEEEEEDATL